MKRNLLLIALLLGTLATAKYSSVRLYNAERDLFIERVLAMKPGQVITYDFRK